MAKNNARLGTIGEYMTAVKLMQRGYDVVNLNQSLPNMKSVDLFVYDDEHKRHTLVQVKTTKENTFPTGFSLAVAENRSLLEKEVTCAFVFVKESGPADNPQYTYYVLSRDQMINLTYLSHDWYLHKIKRPQPVKLSGMCCIQEKWLQGLNDKPKRLQGDEFINPLGKNTRDEWDNIWN